MLQADLPTSVSKQTVSKEALTLKQTALHKKPLAGANWKSVERLQLCVKAVISLPTKGCPVETSDSRRYLILTKKRQLL